MQQFSYLPACSVICYKVINGDTYPFSVSFEAIQENTNIQSLALFAATVPVVGVHALIRWLLPGYGMLFYVLILLAANFIAWKKHSRKRRRWTEFGGFSRFAHAFRRPRPTAFVNRAARVAVVVR